MFSDDNFPVTIKALGTLTGMRIWHNNGGQYPAWYLASVKVRDNAAGVTYFFAVDQWIYGNSCEFMYYKTQ